MKRDGRWGRCVLMGRWDEAVGWGRVQHWGQKSVVGGWSNV